MWFSRFLLWFTSVYSGRFLLLVSCNSFVLWIFTHFSNYLKRYSSFMGSPGCDRSASDWSHDSQRRKRKRKGEARNSCSQRTSDLARYCMENCSWAVLVFWILPFRSNIWIIWWEKYPKTKHKIATHIYCQINLQSALGKCSRSFNHGDVLHGTPRKLIDISFEIWMATGSLPCLSVKIRQPEMPTTVGAISDVNTVTTIFQEYNFEI
jgi:hypothetical protein